ncbi:hypothetical protein TNIN_91211 [Trichonephila inaurata madagascariensis]|uniref:Uncharacterized protein n=1 Tax=Trichonephila inaurata madagascariensis TaxID=2747483 RepID=A0A8X7C4Z8_9ARAC|nr:hypothetical protein TNIN_91211 [Trichonephila inaurata madagascariensis]
MLKSSAPDHNHILLGGARTASLMDDDDVWMMMTLNPSWRQFITSSSNGQTEEMQNKELLAGILPQMNNFMVIGKNPSVPKEELRVIDEEEMKCLSPGLLHGKIDLKSVTYGEARRLHEAVKLIKRLYYNEKFVKDYFIASFYFFFTNVVTDAYHFIVF